MNENFDQEIKRFLEKNHIEFIETMKVYKKRIQIKFKFKKSTIKFILTLSKGIDGKTYRIIVEEEGEHLVEFNQYEKDRIKNFLLIFEKWLKEESSEKLRINLKNPEISYSSNLYLLLPENKRNELDKPIELLELSTRTYNCLKRAYILSLRSILQFNLMQLCCIEGMGEKSISEIIKKANEYGYEIK